MSDEEKKEPIIEVKPDERFALVHARLDTLSYNFVFVLAMLIFLIFAYIILLGAIMDSK
jgi:hypothetical protein